MNRVGDATLVVDRWTAMGKREVSPRGHWWKVRVRGAACCALVKSVWVFPPRFRGSVVRMCAMTILYMSWMLHIAVLENSIYNCFLFSVDCSRNI